MKKAIVTVGLGFGDEGKGATVDHLARFLNADVVVRYSGGSQCGHNVIAPNGKRHTFSQFGSGTFSGANTFIGPQVIVYPEALRNEAHALTKLGVDKPLEFVTVHPKCLITTKYHRAANRLRELSRGADKHGSCGHGIGEARRYWINYGRDAIFAEDLNNIETLTEKLELMRQRFLLDLQPVLAVVENEKEESVFNLLVSDMADGLFECFDPVTVDAELDYETAIFEGAQGVLLDEYNGFHPHTTWSTVTLRNAQEILVQSPADVVVNVGVTRAYTTRHGAGPLPTESKELTEIVNDKGNPTNEWQDNFRAGWLHLNLLEYAARSCGGKLNCLAVNCLDHLQGITPKLGLTPSFLRESRYRLSRSEALNEELKVSRPSFEDVTVERVLDELKKIAPIAVAAHGPKPTDRIVINDTLLLIP